MQFFYQEKIMYCRKCGKQIDYDAPLCNECAQQEAEQAYSATALTVIENDDQAKGAAPLAEENVQKPRMYGFKNSLKAAIFGYISYCAAIASNVFSALLGIGIFVDFLTCIISEESGNMVATEISPFAIFGIVNTLLLVVGFAIPALILGIKSIKTYVRRNRAGYAKPIATLVLGIVAVALCACAFSTIPNIFQLFSY